MNPSDLSGMPFYTVVNTTVNLLGVKHLNQMIDFY